MNPIILPPANGGNIGGQTRPLVLQDLEREATSLGEGKL